MRKLVYILDMNGNPLMPCEPVVARLLRKGSGTKCVKREPFTIKLLQPTTEYRQPLTLGIDPGSTKIGAAVVDNFGNVVYMSEVEVRNDVTDNMKQRAMYRRNRRNRKCRYRKCRFLNRKNSIRKDRFSPTVVSKMSSHLKEIAFVKSILPITEVVVETVKFDPHALKNPAVLTNNWLYQHGTNFGFANTHAYVLDRDEYACQHCYGKSKGKRLEVHHIIFRCNGGSDDESNLIVLCDTCHSCLHDGKISLKKNGKRKGGASQG